MKVTRIREQLRATTSKVRTGGQSRLETVAVKPPTAKDYKNRLKKFDDFCNRNQLDADTEHELDLALLEFFDEMFLDKEPLDVGTKTLAAVGDRRPEFYRSSRSGKLPRARRALQGWGKVDPLAARLPLPWPVVLALAAVAAMLKDLKLCIAILVAADGYLRPTDLLDIQPEDVTAGHGRLGPEFRHTTVLLAPFQRGKSTKTNEFNDSVIFDTQGREWIGEALAVLAKKAPPGKKLFQLSISQFNKAMKDLAEKLKITEMEVVPYLLRHSGPSQDYLAKLRTLPDIQKRGGWRSPESVRRYEKAARVMSRLTLLNEAQLAFCQHACLHIRALANGLPVPKDMSEALHRI